MPKKILIALACLFGLVLVVGALLPSSYRVERSRVVRAPAEVVYAQVADLRRWSDWAPWHVERYPGAQWMFGGAARGTGAVRSWTGEAVGAGTLSLSSGDPTTGVAYAASLDGGRARVQGHISLASVEGGTQVTWVDEGEVGGNPFVHYLVPLVRSRLGEDFERALEGLGRVVEAAPAPAAVPPPEAVPDAGPVRAVAPEPVPVSPPPPVLAEHVPEHVSEALPDAGPVPETPGDAGEPLVPRAPEGAPSAAHPDAGGEDGGAPL